MEQRVKGTNNRVRVYESNYNVKIKIENHPNFRWSCLLLLTLMAFECFFLSLRRAEELAFAAPFELSENEVVNYDTGHVHTI